MDRDLTPLRRTTATAAAIAGANLLILTLGRLAGADMRVVQRPGSAATQVGISQVLLMSITPALLGGLALWLAARRSPGAWRTIGWLGLALGVVSAPIPFTVQASAGTSVTLAAMHLVAGLLWFTSVRRAAAHQEDNHQAPAPAPDTAPVREHTNPAVQQHGPR